MDVVDQLGDHLGVGVRLEDVALALRLKVIEVRFFPY